MDNIVILALVACALSALIGLCIGASVALYVAGRNLPDTLQVVGQTQVLPDYFDRTPRPVSYNPRPETIALRDSDPVIPVIPVVASEHSAVRIGRPMLEFINGLSED